MKNENDLREKNSKEICALLKEHGSIENTHP